jgi:trans-aconitate methyltransferase
MSISEPVADAAATKPNAARIYDYLLGGKDFREADREAAERLLELVPDASVACYGNRQFLGRAVRYLVGGTRPPVRQVVDIGSGLPTLGQVHSVARLVARDTRIVYVDYDPEVLDQSRCLLTHESAVAAICRDLRQPGEILNDPELLSLIDFTQPVAILLTAILHFIPDSEHPYEIVQRLKRAMAPGSYLAVSHVTADNATPDVTAGVARLYEHATAPSAPRTRAQIMRFFDGLELVTPGLVNVSEWRNDFMPEQPGRTIFYAGVAKKP